MWHSRPGSHRSHGHGAAASGLAITFTCCRRDIAVAAATLLQEPQPVWRALSKNTHTHIDRLSGCVIRLRVLMLLLQLVMLLLLLLLLLLLVLLLLLQHFPNWDWVCHVSVSLYVRT